MKTNVNALSMLAALLVFFMAANCANVAPAVTVSGKMFELEKNRLLTSADGTVIIVLNLGGQLTELARSDNGEYRVTVPDDVRFTLEFSRGGGVTNRLELRSVATRDMQIDLPVPEFTKPCLPCRPTCRRARFCGRWF